MIFRFLISADMKLRKLQNKQRGCAFIQRVLNGINHMVLAEGKSWIKVKDDQCESTKPVEHKSNI